MLSISRADLARTSGVAERTISDFESGRRQPIRATVAALQLALEAGGIEFFGTPDDGPGIRLRRQAPHST